MSVIFTLEAPYRGAWHLHRVTFGGPGPAAVAMVAGLHGHEVNGVHALNLVAGMLRVLRPRRPVHILPCVNSIGAEEGRKRWPFDDRDINTSFPGDPDGAAVERVAAAVMSATEAEVCVDVHSGPTTAREHPHVRTALSGLELEQARAMQLPVLWRRPASRQDGSLIQAWRGAGRSAIQVRGGRGMALDVDDATTMARGLVRLLAHLGVVGPQDAGPVLLETDRVEDYRSVTGGFFVPEVRTGERLVAGTLLGLVRNALGGEPIEEVRARRPGVVLAVRLYPMVHAQELLVRVAE